MKKQFLELLDKDVEFRYTVAGYLGLSEILRRLDSVEESIKRLWEEVRALREDQRRLWESANKLWEEVRALREGQNKLWENVNRLWDNTNRLWEEVRSLREGQNKLWEEVKALREGQAEMWREIAKLREDMKAGFESVHRLVTALGARWGLMSEEAFREGMRAVLEKEFGVKVEKWVTKDEEGLVFDRLAIVDVVIRDEKVTLIEVRSHIGLSDVSAFVRKAKLYEMKTGKKAHRLLIVTPFIDPRALEVAKELGIEVYTKT